MRSKSKPRTRQELAIAAIAVAFATYIQAQTATNPCPNAVISWNLDDWSTINPTDLAGLAPATNWVDTYLNNITTAVTDNSGNPTSLGIGWYSYNTWSIQGSHPGYDANGTANRELLNGFLNTGYSTWEGAGFVTNNILYFTNVPYARYDIIVYLSDDTSGRHYTVDDGNGQMFYGTTMGSAEISGPDALFVPATSTNSASFPQADFAVFLGETSTNLTITQTPKSGADQWTGIAGWQIIQESNTYVIYGPSPATQTVPLGHPATFSVIASGLKPSYQWLHGGVAVASATNATYTIPTTATGQDGNYSVIVSNSFSSVTSSVAALVFYTPKNLRWDGNGSTWDTTSANWTTNNGTSTTAYTDTDYVQFDSLGIVQSAVTVSSEVAPGSIIVSNATYTLTGANIIGSGPLNLVKNGTLILDLSDNSSGPISIDNTSTLQVGNNDTLGVLGSGTLTNNGTLNFALTSDEAYGYPVYGTGSITNLGSSGEITLANNIQAKNLVQAGGGTLLLQGSNTLSGGFVVSGGTVYARAANCLGMAPVTLSGGELQMIFNLDFTGSTLTLSGGLLHGGVSGSDIYEGQVVLATDSSIEVDGGDSFTLANAAGLNGGSFNLTQTSPGTLILAGANNTWASVTISGTLQIGDGGVNGSLGSGTITDSGTLAFDSTANLLVTNLITGIGGLSQNGSGAVTFNGDLSTLTGITTVSSGTLGGNTTNGCAVSVLPGATLAPGTPTAIGTMTIEGGLTLGGNLLVKLNKSLVQPNDIVAVPGGANNTNNGLVTVKNLGPALAVGDKFSLFSQPVSGGETLAVLGEGVIWSNNLANDGSIIIISTTVPHPAIRNLSLSAGNFVIGGTNGYPGAPFALLTTTNLTSTDWTVVATGNFGATGAFSVTNANMPGAPQAYYRLEQ
ncbi:MAG: hypothetical protein ABSH48_14140 [Verrucomicrobiota bacterium]